MWSYHGGGGITRARPSRIAQYGKSMQPITIPCKFMCVGFTASPSNSVTAE